MIRTNLDRFELIAELASGGMGTVFLARLGGVGGFQRLYAIKRLHEHLARHAEFVEMFLDEARLAARIHHPNVVPILEIGTTEAGYYLVMEYVEGDTAGHLFRCADQENKPLSPRIAIRIALDALAGLHAAHEGYDDDGQPLEIVHRDVSPHNILVSVDGVARITDFGIARAAARLAVTRTGQLKGKVSYMAPEQARSEKVDRRADVFALGICLWEMLAHRRLFRADAEGETLNRLLYEPIPSLRSVDPSIPEELDAICAKALSRDIEGRFATAVEFADALEHAARKLDLFGSHREVAAGLTEILGTDLAERRAGLRAWLADPERKSTMPPDGAQGFDYDRPAGAQVSVYVPPLFDAGTLGPHAEGSQPSRPRARGLSKGLGAVGLTVAIAIAGSVGGARWLHSCAREQTVSAASEVATPLKAVAPSEPHAVPSLRSTEAVRATAEVASQPPVETIAAIEPPADALDASTPRPTTSIHAQRAIAAAPSAAAADAARPSRASQAAAQTAAQTATAPRTAPSVPSDMLYNPYR